MPVAVGSMKQYIAFLFCNSKVSFQISEEPSKSDTLNPSYDFDTDIYHFCYCSVAHGKRERQSERGRERVIIKYINEKAKQNGFSLLH